MDKPTHGVSVLWKRLLAQYEQLVMENYRNLSTFDSLMRGGAYFLPAGIFGDAEIQYEAGQVAVNLISFFNDLIIVKYFYVNPRFHEILTRKIPPPESILFSAAKALTAMHYTELFAEMLAARKWKEKGQWVVVVTIEFIRAAIRLFVLFHTRGCLLIQQTVPQRDVLLGPARAAPPRRSAVTNRKLIGDLVYVARPLLYLLAMWRLGRRSWHPWLIALGLDVLSRILIGPKEGLSDQERDEVARRTAQWGWAIMRAPCFDALLENENLQFLGSLGNIPLLGSLLRSILDYIKRYRNYYFWTAASS